jgi:hypothetical protein
MAIESTKPRAQLIEQAISAINEGYVEACHAPEHQSPEGTTSPTLGFVARDKIERMLKRVPEERLRDMPLSSLGATIGAKLAESTKQHRMSDAFWYFAFKPRVNKVNVVTIDDNKRQLEAMRRDVSHEEVPDVSRSRAREIRKLLEDG